MNPGSRTRSVSDSFRERVWQIVRAIPEGKVMGYGHVASALAQPGMARQVGWALAALPVDTDVPWQRVVRSSGHIAAQGAVDRAILQRALLESEGVGFVGDRVIMETFRLGPEHFLDRAW
ncbi:MAG: MGMT family protein [Myxococcales bacterium]|nr:MGMT family protein [Myxococcales bacterium]